VTEVVERASELISARGARFAGRFGSKFLYGIDFVRECFNPA
jgi:hypothetical protein